jgi:hypothetical protein
MTWRNLLEWRTYDPSLYSPSEILQRDERIKAISLFANNAGLALLATGVARWFDSAKGLDGAAIAALCVGTLGVTLSVAICVFLQEVDWP